MAEYVDREAFVRHYRELYCADCDSRKGMKNGKLKFCYEIGGAPCRACRQNDVLDDLEDYPAADVVEVRHGKWVAMGQTNPRPCYACSCCNSLAPIGFMGTYAKSTYCPNCGAKMDGDGE